MRRIHLVATLTLTAMVMTVGLMPALADTVPVPADSTEQVLPERAAEERSFFIRHPLDSAGRRASGDGLTVYPHGSIGLSAQVLDGDSEPVVGHVVDFHLVAPKEKSLGHALTNQDGIAIFVFESGKKTGKHTIIASIAGRETRENHIVYHVPVRKKSWVLFMGFGLLGGLGLFLFGMNMMSASLQRSAGGRMRAILGALTRNRFIGAGVGAFVTMVIQSSSATTVMMVSFVQAKLMTFAQTLGVILGADIGTTITAQLIAFKLTDYALLMIALGFGMRVLVKRESLRVWGDVVLGFGMLFFGMAVMSNAMYPLRSFSPFIDMLRGLENPILGILVGAAFTALVQSSSAFTGILIVLAQQGFITLDAGIPMLFGANIGTCITAALATMGTGPEAKRVALAHTTFKVAGVLLVVAWIPAFADLVRKMSGGEVLAGDTVNMARVIPRQIANAHTLFNVGLAVIFLPFTNLAARFVTRMIPERREPEQRFTGRFLDPGMLNAPALALNLAKAEILRMGKRVKVIMDLSAKPFLQRDLEALGKIKDLEHEVDELYRQISTYLVEIGKRDLSKQQTEEVYLMMHVTKQYEHVADIVDNEMGPMARKMIQGNISFSETGAEEVRTYHAKAAKQVSRSLAAFREGSLDKAQRITRKQIKYARLEGSYRQAHFERIHGAVQESVASSEIHLDLMDALRRINSYAANVARAMIDADTQPEASEETDQLDTEALMETHPEAPTEESSQTPPEA
jgi:phosphate:Na+ symporter